MGLSPEARDRLADVVELQPTTNGELGDRWGMDDGSAVHAYLEDELGEYYERNDDGYVVATPEAADLVDVEPALEVTDEAVVVRGDPLQRRIVEALPGPDGDPISVVATLQAVRDRGLDPEVDAVRETLRTLKRSGVVETVQRTVPVYRLSVPRERITVEE